MCLPSTYATLIAVAEGLINRYCKSSTYSAIKKIMGFGACNRVDKIDFDTDCCLLSMGFWHLKQKLDFANARWCLN